MMLQFRWVFNRGLGDERESVIKEWEVVPNDDAQEAELFKWWMEVAISDFNQTVPKMLEYGGHTTGPATDLVIIGRNLAELLDMHDAPDPVLMELGCWFYIQSKIARLVSDYKQKRPGKPDTWFDATIYALMARRIQDTGRWP